LIPAEVMPGGFPTVIFTLAAGLLAIVYEFVFTQKDASANGKLG